jgi:hypothetical protein
MKKYKLFIEIFLYIIFITALSLHQKIVDITPTQNAENIIKIIICSGILVIIFYKTYKDMIRKQDTVKKYILLIDVLRIAAWGLFCYIELKEYEPNSEALFWKGSRLRWALIIFSTISSVRSYLLNRKYAVKHGD